jgi:hypothetical protein
MRFLGRLLLVLSFLLQGCGEKVPAWKFKPSFYYWKTTLKLDPTAGPTFTQLGVDRLYIRFFDVTWSPRFKAVIPNRPVLIPHQNLLGGEEVVPVVYVTREALDHLAPGQVKGVAKDILGLAGHLDREMGKASAPELQMDCDWTPGTRETYFALLEAMRAGMAKAFPQAKLSCTIRLSQVKYPTLMGVPPVDRGVLMVYHTASPAKLSEKDSILDLKDAKSYLGGLSRYPLPLDIALPLFSWAVLFSPQKAPLGILNDVGREDLKSNADLREEGHNIFAPLKDTYVKGRSVQKGGWVKVDQPDMAEVEKTVLYLKGRLKGEGARLILFHYDDSMIRRFTDGHPEKVSEIFGL